MLPAEVFLSHAHQDAVIAAWVADLLRRHNVPVWYSPANIVGAQQWHDEIGAALSRCDWLVLLLSPDSVVSKWVKRELLFALDHDRYSNRIVPVQIQTCDPSALSWTLSALQMIDLSTNPMEGCRGLLRVWGLGLRSELLAPWPSAE